MPLFRQILVTLALLLAGLAGWMVLSPFPGRLVLESGLPLPDSVRQLVADLSPEATEPVGATPRGPNGNAAVPLVVVDRAVPAVTRDRLRAIGTGEAVRTVAVRPDVGGILAQIGIRSGDAVEAGAVLAVLQNDTERVAVDRARLALDAAEDQLRRYRSLSQNSSITTVQLDEVARVRDAAALDLQAAEIALAKRNVVAPISGRVGLVDLDIGALVDSSTVVATVDDRSRIKVNFNVPEGFASELALGQSVEAQPTTRSGRVYAGTVSAIDSRLDEASRTLRTEALVENEEDALRPGMSFSVEIAFPGQSYLGVSPLAIQWERAGPFVWVVENEAVRKAPIRIVERNVDRVLMASDEVAENATVVSEGVQQLREGLKVRVQAPVEVPPAPASPEEAVPSAAAEPAGGRRAEVRP